MSKRIIQNFLIAASLVAVLVFAGSAFAQHEQITVCHTTGNGIFELTPIDDSSLQGHLQHGDIYPVPANGCPSGTTPTPAPGATPEPITILLFGAGLTGVGYATRRFWGNKSEA